MGQGQRQSRGQGQGPMGNPKGVTEMDKIKEATELVDVILTGDYKQYKTEKDTLGLVDSLIDEVENKIDTVPNQDLKALYQSVFDELSKDSMTSVEESILYSVRKLLSENAYREFFKTMLKKWNIKSPAELKGDKKKAFFAAVSKEWKAKKGK